MQPVEKKKRRALGSRSRLIALLIALLMLCAVLIATQNLQSPVETDAPAEPATVELYRYPVQNVRAITVHMTGEPSWTVELDDDTGRLRLTGEDGFLLSESTTAALQQAAAVITCEQLISDDPAEYAAHLADYGLDAPERTAIITFTDGAVYTLRIGLRAPHTTAWYYMAVDGDDRLFALSSGLVDELFVSRESLWDVTQPTIHQARIDRLTLRGSDGSIRAEWQLNAAIGDDDAAEQWRITAPFAYPADSSAMTGLLANAANLRLGAYVAPATEENLAAYGFLAPRLTIELHMAAGSMATTDMDGAVTVTDWPESTVTFVIGGARSDMVDYVLHEGSIYVSSHFTMGVFEDATPEGTMNRYPVLTALGNLASLTIEEGGATTAYVLTRTEQVAPNNDLVYDDDGNLVWDVTVTRNGEAFDYAAFEAAYTRLVGVSVAGTIPEGDAVSSKPHTIYTFTDVNGSVHTVALTSYGVLHDAVSVDGHQAFYIAKGAFKLDLE